MSARRGGIARDFGGHELLGEGLDQGLDLVFIGHAGVGDVGQHRSVLAPSVLEQLGFEAAHVGDVDVVEVAPGAGVENHDLLLDRHR